MFVRSTASVKQVKATANDIRLGAWNRVEFSLDDFPDRVLSCFKDRTIHKGNHALPIHSLCCPSKAGPSRGRVRADRLGLRLWLTSFLFVTALPFLFLALESLLPVLAGPIELIE